MAIKKLYHEVVHADYPPWVWQWWVINTFKGILGYALARLGILLLGG